MYLRCLQTEVDQAHLPRGLFEVCTLNDDLIINVFKFQDRVDYISFPCFMLIRRLVWS